MTSTMPTRTLARLLAAATLMGIAAIAVCLAASAGAPAAPSAVASPAAPAAHAGTSAALAGPSPLPPAPQPPSCPQIDRVKTPGRQVRVSAIPIGFGGDHGTKLAMALSHLETDGRLGVDIACLPEEFAGCTAETIPGPTTSAVAEVAKKHHMYVICPIREQAGKEEFNTAVLIDRQGRIAGFYRKVFVYWGEGLNVSRDGVKVFDTDFGRISILTCFDLNFAELWQDAEKQGAEIVFWPSAYGGGQPLNANAMLHGYYIVPVGVGNIIDCTGATLDNLEKPCPNHFIATLDLDRTFLHENFNGDKLAKLLAEHKGEVEVEKHLPLESWWLLRATRPGVRALDLCKQYHIETLREYRHRSRDQINQARTEGKRI